MERTPITICLTLLFVLTAAAVRGQGILVPGESARIVPPQPVPFVVVSHHVDVSIEHQVARTTVNQVYENESPRDLEGVYIFPVPTGASISNFAMWMNGEKVTGEVIDAARARRIYEDIVRRMKDPALLEYLGRDMFRARVYPVPARNRVKIEIAFDQMLRFDSDLVEYCYPVGSHRGRVTRDGVFSLNVQIESDTPIKSLYSPTHDIDRTVSGRTASCSYESRTAPEGDFLLYYGLSEKDVGLTLLSCPGSFTTRHGDGRGYFALLLSPGRLEHTVDAPGKDVVFVIDRSGSMKGEKIEQAKGAAQFCLRSLNEKDRFNIVTFATSVERFNDGLVVNGDGNIERALRFVGGVSARGGTDINDALIQALDMPRSKRPQVIIFLTDGAPTFGETDIGRILENIERANSANVRIFVFGVGYDVNTMLLDKLALDNRGTVAYVKPEEDIEIKVSNFYAKLGRPVLADIVIDYGRIRVFDVYPKELPDLFDGSQVVVFGRYEGQGPTAITLEGYVGERKRDFTYDARFGSDTEGGEVTFIPRLWASRKIAYLIEEMRLHGENRELIDEVVALSIEHGIITPYTSYLILEDDRWAGVPRPMYERIIAEAPQARSVGRAMKSETGFDAVSLSSDIAGAKETSVVSGSAVAGVTHVNGKTFYSSDGVWTDAEYDDEVDTVDIGFLSDAYFDLIDRYPVVAAYLSLGKTVVFVHEGVAYKITAD